MTDHFDGADLRRHLDRWVAQGLIDGAQAARIESAEAARAGEAPAGALPASVPAPGPPATREAAATGAKTPAALPARSTAPRTPLVIEALGYAGGVLAIIAGFLMVRELWPGIPTGAELALAAVACVALGVAGAALHTAKAPAFGRLRSALWLMSTASLAALMGVLAYQVWKLSPVSTALVVAAAATVYGTALWLRTRAPLQHLAVFASVAVFTGTGVAWLGPGLGRWGPGLGVWVLSALWGVAAFRGYLPSPRAAGYLAAGAGLLTGAQLTMQVAAGHVLALATVAGLLAAGVLLRRAWMVMLGAAGVMLVVPQTATRYLPTSAAAPLAIFVTGLVLLGSAIWLAQRRARPR